MESARIIALADGFASLGLYEDAWEALESLPASERLRPAVLRVRLMICAGLERWELGREIALVIASSYRLEVREAAGRFHLAHAIALCALQDIAGARGVLNALSSVWPEGRLLALESKALEVVW